jgi:hypothetical protein
MGRKVWVLETSTKGTGANMVPLERVLQSPSSNTTTPVRVPRKPRPRPAPEPAPRAPRRFKIVDLLTRQVLGEDMSAAATVAALRDVRSVVDVNLYVWEPARKRAGHERWRLLTVAEQGAMWELRDRQ